MLTRDKVIKRVIKFFYLLKSYLMMLIQIGYLAINIYYICYTLLNYLFDVNTASLLLKALPLGFLLLSKLSTHGQHITYMQITISNCILILLSYFEHIRSY